MKGGRTLLVLVLVAAIVATAVSQKFAVSQRRAVLKTSAGTAQGSSLANMDSFALALLLGGMRGPLVMFLWMNSEASKQQKDLAGVETQIEWIRLLQPEFDTVHLFQIWNKAYNISAQMASLANKYSVILDGIEYSRAIDRQRPNDINMLMAMANLYNDKLGGAAEKAYYRKRVREDTRYREEKVEPRLAGARPTRHPSLLLENGLIRPDLLKSTGVHLVGGSDVYDGAELGFLKSMGEFPYGMSPYALAYNYYKRSQVLQMATGQEHLQISKMVVDSRPGLCLRSWNEEEWTRAAQAEARLFGLPVKADRFDAVLETSQAKLDALSPADLQSRKDSLAEALYQYDLAIRLADMSMAEFTRHLADPQYEMHVGMYRSHLEHLNAVKLLLMADRIYLQSLTAEPARRAELAGGARDLYRQAVRSFRIIDLRYFVSPELYPKSLPPGTQLQDLEKLNDAQLAATIQRLGAAIREQGYDMNEDDTREYMSFINRGLHRIGLLDK